MSLCGALRVRQPSQASGRAPLPIRTGPRLSGCPDILAKGPGIRDTVPLPFVPTKTFLEEWQDNNDRFPQGVDVIFCGQGLVAGLPRTTRLFLQRS